MKYEQLIRNVQDWAEPKDIKPQVQLTKIMEELGETSEAYNKRHYEDLVDSIGDLQVTIIIFANLIGVDYQDALESAWNEIKDRQGKTVDGVFIKDKDLKKGGRK